MQTNIREMGKVSGAPFANVHKCCFRTSLSQKLTSYAHSQDNGMPSANECGLQTPLSNMTSACTKNQHIQEP